ncbi:MAG TPA: hypothetical protein VFT90_11995, partial [Chryseosolibacter sp.]|nr:hypothetical protein [Chryseosolibacter sp.]
NRLHLQVEVIGAMKIANCPPVETCLLKHKSCARAGRLEAIQGSNDMWPRTFPSIALQLKLEAIE